MQKSHFSIYVLVFMNTYCLTGQTIEIFGEIKGVANVENIHIFNKTSQSFTISDKKGYFKIYAKLNDTLSFSSIQYEFFALVIDAAVISNMPLIINLKEKINQLDEVIVGKILTGDLLLDINNSDAKPEINFYDVGIPGFKGKPMTRNERRLYEANGDGLNYKVLIMQVLSGSIPINPILNGISGRTKILKKRVGLDKRDELMHHIKTRLSEGFFEQYPLDESLRIAFFYFCSEDADFLERCQHKNDLLIIDFLKEKYDQFIPELKTIED